MLALRTRSFRVDAAARPDVRCAGAVCWVLAGQPSALPGSSCGVLVWGLFSDFLTAERLLWGRCFLFVHVVSKKALVEGAIAALCMHARE